MTEDAFLEKKKKKNGPLYILIWETDSGKKKKKH